MKPWSRGLSGGQIPIELGIVRLERAQATLQGSRDQSVTIALHRTGDPLPNASQLMAQGSKAGRGPDVQPNIDEARLAAFHFKIGRKLSAVEGRRCPDRRQRQPSTQSPHFCLESASARCLVLGGSLREPGKRDDPGQRLQAARQLRDPWEGCGALDPDLRSLFAAALCACDQAARRAYPLPVDGGSISMLSVQIG